MTRRQRVLVAVVIIAAGVFSRHFVSTSTPGALVYDERGLLLSPIFDQRFPSAASSNHGLQPVSNNCKKDGTLYSRVRSWLSPQSVNAQSCDPEGCSGHYMYPR